MPIKHHTIPGQAAHNAILKSPEEMWEKCQKYFDICDQGEDYETLTKRGDIVKGHRKIPYTLADLALYLGFSNRQALHQQHERGPAWSDIHSRAKAKIEAQRIKAGLLGEHDARIVNLDLCSNFGYSPKQSVEVDDKRDLSDDEITARIAALESRRIREVE